MLVLKVYPSVRIDDIMLAVLRSRGKPQKPAPKAKQNFQDTRPRYMKSEIKKRLTLEIPEFRTKDESKAHKIIFEIDSKSRFNVKGSKHKLNQHSVKYTFEDESYIIFKKNTAEGFDGNGNTIGVIKHGNVNILN